MTAARKYLLVLFVALVAGGALLWLTHYSETPFAASWRVAEGQAEQGKYELMHSDEIRQLLEDAPHTMVLVDVRNKTDYREGHIPGAINVPIQDHFWSRWSDKQRLTAALGTDKNRYAVFYGADLSCDRSDFAARVAVELGYAHVFRAPKGFADWKEERLRVSKVSSALPGGDDSEVREPLVFGWAMIGTLLSIFVGGIALNLTPCVYPLVPITVSYFSSRKDQRRLFLALHGLLYVSGLSLTNSVLGVAAALTGGLMGSALQHPAVLVVVGIVLLALASSLFGYWEFRLPSALTTWASRSYAGYAGSLFMGMTLGLVAAPCVGPFVLGLLTWVAKMGSPLMGFLVFFMLSLGLGLPLFVLALVSGSLSRLPASGEWMLWVRKLMAWILVGMAAYFVGPVLPDSYDVLLLAAVIVAASLHLGWIDRTVGGFKGFKVLRFAVGMAGLVWACFLIGTFTQGSPAFAWRAYSVGVLAEAREEKKPVIMDFFASWCVPCRQMERETFTDPDVIKQAQHGFVMVKVDLTQAVDNDKADLLKRFQVKGVPTVVFLDSHGQERTDLRLVGSAPPSVFLNHMAQVKRVPHLMHRTNQPWL